MSHPINTQIEENMWELAYGTAQSMYDVTAPEEIITEEAKRIYKDLMEGLE